MTLNQVQQRIKNYAESHGQIQHYHFGNVWEIVTSDHRHTTCCCELNGGNVAIGSCTLNFSFYFMDWQAQDEHNELEVQSDMLSVSADFLALLNSAENDWTLTTVNPVSFFTETTPDYLAGVKMDVLITFDLDLDRCAVPDV